MLEFLETLYSRIDFTIILVLGTAIMAFRLPRRKYFVLRLSLSLLVIFAYEYLRESVLNRFEVFRNPFFSFFMIFLLCLAGLVLCFNCDFWSYLFCATAGYCIQHASYHMYRLATRYLTLGTWTNIILEFLFQAAVCAIIFFLFSRKFLPKNAKVSIGKHMQIIIAAVVLAVSVFISHYAKGYALNYARVYNAYVALYELHYLEEIPARMSANPSLMMDMVLLYTIITSALGLFIELSMFFAKKTKDELAVAKRMWNLEREQYKQSKENIEIINIKSHDLKHQLATLKGKLNEREFDEITQAVGIYDSAIKTGNAALDIVLTEKSLICTKNKIRLTCLIDGKWFDGFPEHEMYSLFGNALDNAIESVKAVDEEMRSISVVAYCKDGVINLQIENYYLGKVNFINGMPITQKDTDYHGFGVKSMKLLAKKHGGDLSAETNGDIFTLTITLPVRSDNQP